MKEAFKPFEEGKMSFNPTVKPVPNDDYIANLKNDESEKLKKELIRRMESGCEERQVCPHCKTPI
ncbi:MULTISPECIES: hypothetical protein [Providencia]|uniref:hypothetical protein n=1 Tax=Providencia TaxID=586 RepID=UPI001ADA34EF|nr:MULTISPECIES: hypothetical protein [Providencia]MBO8254919.1 hypothetical protein [Providencia rettgeri]MBO8259106.1 hypothetical protein [Providencia rettgeri]MDE4731237.1 hypothetical protein [Providencia rettgeri]